MISTVTTTTTEISIPTYNVASYIIGIILILLIVLWIVMKYKNRDNRT